MELFNGLDLHILLKTIDKIAEGITIADARQDDFPLIYVNEGFSNLTGYSREEAIGRNCRYLQGPDTNPEAVSKIRDSLEKKESCVVELLNYRKDNSKFWNRLSIVPLKDKNGIVTHFAGIQSDITEEKRRLKEKSELNAMRTTVQTVNDIFLNFMNSLKLYEMILEEHLDEKDESLADFKKSFNTTMEKMKVLNEQDEYREKHLYDDLKILDLDK